MTTTAALLAALALCVTPLGVSIVSGLIVSQALTLYTTPIISHYLDRLGLRLRLGRAGRRRRTAAAAPASAPPTSSGMISARRK